MRRAGPFAVLMAATSSPRARRARNEPSRPPLFHAGGPGDGLRRAAARKRRRPRRSGAPSVDSWRFTHGCRRWAVVQTRWTRSAYRPRRSGAPSGT